jgi:3D (Asp-Asp-Asp) domain-containing protein
MKNFLVALLIVLVCVLSYFLFTKEKIIYVEKEVIREIVREVKVEPNFEIFEATAYTEGFESTGKNPGDKDFGFTASGEPVLEGRTIACPKSMEFGTAIYIPMFENVFYCTDRGSAITEGKIDIYMVDINRALEFGRRYVEVFVLP